MHSRGGSPEEGCYQYLGIGEILSLSKSEQGRLCVYGYIFERVG